nr:MAG: structural protein [Densovirinae sp.]
MARLLDTSSESHFGYFYTVSFDDVIYYIKDLLSCHDESLLLTIHASAIFTNAGGEQTELHMPALQPTLFDPHAPDAVFDDAVQNIWDALNDPERYESIEGSGWSIIPGTTTYWVNTIAYQPNNNAHPNAYNTYDHPYTDDPDDPAYSNTVRNVLNDTFLLSIALHHIPYARHHNRVLRKRNCQRWIEESSLSPEADAPKINLGTVATWHENVHKFHIRIFSELGNVIYNKWYPITDDKQQVINLLHRNRKFSYITNLWTLLKEKRDRPFCSACKKFHASEEQCAHTVSGAKSEDIKIPELPKGKHAVVFYADFESYIDHGTHKPSGYCLVMLINGFIKEKIVISLIDTDEIAGHFMKTLIKLCEEYTYSDASSFECKICGQLGAEPNVYGRNYINGEEGCYHSDCWEDFRNCAFVFFHNFRGYDSHYVLAEAMKYTDIGTLRGKSFEKFDLISCTANIARFTFKDTFNFFSTSLAALVKQVKFWHYTPPEARHSKGVFPYDWFDDPQKLTYTSLPPQELWYNKLTQSMIDSTEGFKIWEEKQMETFNDYHNYYMTMDVLQLADIFEEFRDSVLDEFNTDPVYCQGSPSLTWQLCLQQYAEKIKVIRDPKIYVDIQKNIRGGISQVMTRYCNVEQRGGEIMYLDINSLYSACMTEKLPTNYIATLYSLPLDWMLKFAANGEYCALMNVDLHYPEHLHDKHRFYPLAPHKYNNRLCATFLDRTNYLVHSDNLKFYLDNGMVLIKFNYAYVFRQDYILKDYVDSNIRKRIKASSEDNKVLVSLFKLLNNSLYGKTCENKFKYKKFSIKQPFEGIYGKKNPFLYKARNFYEIEDKILCEDDISSIVLDKPIQIGFTVLEKAKLRMYSFYYELMEYCPKVELLYTDTDSLMLWFPDKDPQMQLMETPLQRIFDFEKAPEWFNVRTIGTDKVSGKWSLEADKRVQKFVGLRAKTYAILYEDGTSTLKNKGIVRTAKEEISRQPLQFEDYEKCLFQGEEIYVEQVLIRSRLHNIKTITQKKLALSSDDQKRVILADKITTLPFGYNGEVFRDNNTILPSADNL